jgi:hypothetical protein
LGPPNTICCFERVELNVSITRQPPVGLDVVYRCPDDVEMALAGDVP